MSVKCKFYLTRTDLNRFLVKCLHYKFDSRNHAAVNNKKLAIEWVYINVAKREKNRQNKKYIRKVLGNEKNLTNLN